jgi:hypothetical protein
MDSTQENARGSFLIKDVRMHAQKHVTAKVVLVCGLHAEEEPLPVS